MSANQEEPQPATPEENPLSEVSLQQHLNEYRQALEQEFTAAQAKTPENVEELTRDFFKDNSAHAAAQIAWLAMNAESESVRLNASKFIIAAGQANAAADGDPIKQLLKELTTSTPIESELIMSEPAPEGEPEAVPSEAPAEESAEGEGEESEETTPSEEEAPAAP